MKVVIVNVNKSRVSKNIEYHLFTIKSFIDSQAGSEIETEIVNIFMTDDMRTSVDLLENQEADVMLFRMFHWNVGYIFKLADLYDSSKELKGLWGHDAFAYPEKYLKKNFDFIIQDEPELSLYEIAMLKNSGKSVANAAGILFKDVKNRTFVYGENRVIADLDSIPSPYLNKMVEIDENTVIYWEIARGCLFKCNFCVDFSHENTLRYHTFSYLEKELQYFAKRGVRQLIVAAPIANLSHQHFKKILSLINKYLPDAIFEIQVRPDLLSKSDVEELSEMNVFLNIGLQTTNQKVHENMTTSFNVFNALSNIKYMANFPSLLFGIDIIAGLPKTSYEDFLNDLETAFNLWPVSLTVLRLSIYPGTKIYNRIREFTYTIENNYPYRAIETAQFGRKELEKVNELSKGIELLYNRGRMVSIITILAKGLEIPCHEIIARWNKWIKKQHEEISCVEDVETIEYQKLFEYIHEFFSYLFDRFQKKKLWPIASDLLKQNHFYTTSLTIEKEDAVSLPYQIDAIVDSTLIGINDSAFFDKFYYDIEDVVEMGYIDLKRYVSEADKEEPYAVVYRIEGGVFTKVISKDEFTIFKFIRSKGFVSISDVKEKFNKINVLNIVSSWCDEGVLFIVADN